MQHDIPDCPDCLKSMVETVAKRATDPKTLAAFEAERPEEAREIRDRLRKILNRPDDKLQDLARALAVEAKKRVGLFQN